MIVNINKKVNPKTEKNEIYCDCKITILCVENNTKKLYDNCDNKQNAQSVYHWCKE